MYIAGLVVFAVLRSSVVIQGVSGERVNIYYSS
jgi:hypothetical protein